jgi:LPXTG-motif cell wall-anchored protein
VTLTPTAAFAGEGYPNGPVPEDVVVSETTPEEGEPVEVIVAAGEESPEATLTVTSDPASIPDSAIQIAGTQSSTKATTAGAATFNVTLFEEGRYALTGYDANGEVVGETMLVVGDAAPGGGAGGTGGDTDAGAGAGSDDSDAFGSTGGLGDTGTAAGTALIGGAGVVLLLGGGALLYSRRRKATLA